ncbi:MAG: ATP-dependent Clp protease adaptor ClpS, partial [Acidimicrobiales bacterium]
MTSTLDHPSTISLPEVVDEDISAFFEVEDLWAVIVWNDDVTTFQTVIRAFVEIFGHSVERADQLAWKIHRTGKAVAAVR